MFHVGNFITYYSIWCISSFEQPTVNLKWYYWLCTDTIIYPYVLCFGGQTWCAVNFPVKNLELKDYIPLPSPKGEEKVRSKYDLIGNIMHDGKPGEGFYRVFVQRKSEELWYKIQLISGIPQFVTHPIKSWFCARLLMIFFFFSRYEMQDLHVTETLPQMVALSETYMQIYEQQQWNLLVKNLQFLSSRANRKQLYGQRCWKFC